MLHSRILVFEPYKVLRSILNSQKTSKEFSHLSLHMLSHQKVGQGEVPFDDENISIARGFQLHLFSLKPGKIKTHIN